MRNNIAYSSHETAAILGIAPKRLDNLCARAAAGIIPAGRRGRARVFGVPELEVLAIALLLERDLSIPTGPAVALARRLLVAKDGELAVGVLGSLRFDLPRLRNVLEGAVAEAVQDQEPVRRGRPWGKKKRGASL